MKSLIGFVILAAAVVGVYLLNDWTRGEDGKSILHVAEELPIDVEIAHPTQRMIVRTVQAPGDVEAFQEVDISSEIVSKIVEMPVEEGDIVKAGDLLCRLDDAQFKARVLSGEANVAKLKAGITQAQADYDKAHRDFERQKDLSERNATSPLEIADYNTLLIRAKAMLEMRRQELIEAEAFLQQAREDLEKTIIRAPISGVISQRFAKQGEVVVTGTMNNPGTRIMVISDMSVMQVRCRVDEIDAPMVAPDQTARVYLQSDTRRSIEAKVRQVCAKGTKPLGRDVVTFETLALITGEDDRVKPGMTANVEIEVARKDDAVTIPVEAVVYRKRRDLPEAFVADYDAQQSRLDAAARQHLAKYIKLVFCVEDGKARPRLVQTGINDSLKVEVTEGLTLADQVVIGPYRSLDQLKDGSTVKIIESKKPATADPTTQPVTDDTDEPAIAKSPTSSGEAQ